MKQKSFRRAAHSYRLKHVAEREIGRYVTEQELVQAMDQLGFERDFDNNYAAVLCKPVPKSPPGTERRLGFGAHFERCRNRFGFEAVQYPPVGAQ